MREYPMSLSGAVRLISAGSTILVLAVPLLVWSVVPRVRLSSSGEVARWLVVAMPLIPLLAWAWAPRGLEIGEGELRIVRRRWRPVVIPLGDVETVTQLPERWLLGAVRTFGNGGLFGYYGWYYKRGAFRLYATRWKGQVEVVAAGKRVVVSPDDPARFTEGLLAAAPRARAGQAG